MFFLAKNYSADLHKWQRITTYQELTFHNLTPLPFPSILMIPKFHKLIAFNCTQPGGVIFFLLMH